MMYELQLGDTALPAAVSLLRGELKFQVHPAQGELAKNDTCCGGPQPPMSLGSVEVLSPHCPDLRSAAAQTRRDAGHIGLTAGGPGSDLQSYLLTRNNLYSPPCNFRPLFHSINMTSCKEIGQR